MDKAKIDGLELEYEIRGTGEPLLLIGTGPIADSFHPFLREQALTRRYRMIAYHQRGQAGSTHPPGGAPVTFEQHAADAAALLRHLDIPCAHVAGHSTGALIALQLAVDAPAFVHSLALLEPPLMSVPSAPAFLDQVAPAFAAHRAGDPTQALEIFLSAVSSLEWPACRAVLQKNVPGSVAQAMKDAGNVFTGYLAELGRWQFGAEQAAAVGQPVLSVLGTDSVRLFAESHALLGKWFSRMDERVVAGVAHLLHMQDPEPVTSAVGAWLAGQPMATHTSAAHVAHPRVRGMRSRTC